MFVALLDVPGDVHQLHGRDRGHAMILAPGQEFTHRLRVGAAGVAVADVGGEKLQKTNPRASAPAMRAGQGTPVRKETSWFIAPRPA